jgi:MerR family mercuric resistance operon transcriptional regulator
MARRRRTIGRLAAEAGVNVETVRYYERRGLLDRPSSHEGAREYGDEALWRLRYIKTAQAWGWKLADIADLLDRAERAPNFCAAVRETARRRIAEVDQLLIELRVQRAELENFIGDCESKPDAERCPIYRRIHGPRS